MMHDNNNKKRKQSTKRTKNVNLGNINHGTKSYHEVFDSMVMHLVRSSRPDQKSKTTNSKTYPSFKPKTTVDALKTLSAVNKPTRKAALLALRDHADHKISEIEDIVKVTRAVFDPELGQMILEEEQGAERYDHVMNWYTSLLWFLGQISKPDAEEKGTAVVRYGVPIVDSIVISSLRSHASDVRPEFHGDYSDFLGRLITDLEDAIRGQEVKNENTWDAVARGPGIMSKMASGMRKVCRLIEGARHADVALPEHLMNHVNYSIITENQNKNKIKNKNKNKNKNKKKHIEKRTKKILSDCLEAFQPGAILEAARLVWSVPSLYASKVEMPVSRVFARCFVTSSSVLQDMQHLFKLYQYYKSSTNETKKDKKNENYMTLEEAVKIRHLTGTTDIRTTDHDAYRSLARSLHHEKMLALLERMFRVFFSFDEETFRIQLKVVGPHKMAMFTYVTLATNGNVQESTWNEHLQNIFWTENLKEDLPPAWARVLDMNKSSLARAAHAQMMTATSRPKTTPEYSGFEALQKLYKEEIVARGSHLVRDLRGLISKEAKVLASPTRSEPKFKHFKNMFETYSYILAYGIMRMTIESILAARASDLMNGNDGHKPNNNFMSSFHSRKDERRNYKILIDSIKDNSNSSELLPRTCDEIKGLWQYARETITSPLDRKLLEASLMTL
jgi:hypothetical protein